MASRRPIYRKEQKRSVSKTGLLLCLMLAGGVMLVPAGSGLVQEGKARLRDLALASGLVDFDDCVVTSEHTLACGSRAEGTPIPAVMRRIEDSASLAAAEQRRRQQAERELRDLALEVERLTAELKRARLAAGAGSFLPAFTGEVRPTGLTATAPRAGEGVGNGLSPSGAAGDAAPSLSLVPPPEGD